ncbi:MAG: acetyl-CoA carboxylase biotin carboxyl carrier protein [Verrucomicrobiota bacterium]
MQEGKRCHDPMKSFSRKSETQSTPMTLDEIRDILKLMEEHDLSQFELERDGTKLKLRKGGIIEEAQAAPRALPAQASASAATEALESEAASAESDSIKEIPSPMVGTFYRSPSPESDPFVKVGDQVDEETTICIIEAMKVMNEIKAELKGKIQRILVEDSSPVQYGEPLFVVTPS